MRRNIRIMAMLMMGLFVVLGTYFCYSVDFYGGRWFANAYNPRIASQKQQVTAGDILDRTGVQLATTKNGVRTYASSSSMRKAVSHVVGDQSGMVGSGVETFMASYLLGFNQNMVDRVSQLLSDEERRGDDVVLTIDASLHAYIAEQFPSRKRGAVVVLNYRTGEIYALCSFPNFDPKKITEVLSDGEAGALLNRATQGLYPPGSTFKIVTLAAALDNISGLTTRRFNCTGQLPVLSTIVTEANMASHGSVSILDAFKVSCNNAFAALSLELGYDRINKKASAFGFGDNFLFRDLVLYNSSYPTSSQSQDDLAWSGIGQGRVLATPLHMAMIAGAVANDGVMMEPRLLYAVQNAQGKTRVLQSSSVYKRALSAETAAILREYMIETVQSGTATRAALKGYSVGGKTGSAEASNDKSVDPHAWYVGFVDDVNHPLAIAVVVEKGGSGGSVAAPIAKSVLQKAISLGY